MPRLALAVLTLLALPLVGASPEAQKGTHKDPRIGFSIKPPKGWTQVPINADEQWIVAKYFSDKKDRVYDKEAQRGFTMTPEMLVVVFLDEVVNSSDLDDDEDVVNNSGFYRDYEDFLDKRYKGFFIEEDEFGKHKKIPVRKLNVRFEQLSGERVIRYVAWVFETDLGKVAIQFNCYDSSIKKFSKAFERTFKSFKEIERTEALNLDAARDFVSLASVSNFDPEDRMLMRQENERQAWTRMQAGATEGWEAKTVEGVNLLTHVDDSHTKKVAQRVVAVRSWLEKTFPDIGPGEYTRTPQVRICESEAEHNTFLRGTNRTTTKAEIVPYKDTSAGAMSDEWGDICDRTMFFWFFDKDRDLQINLPAWLDVGLAGALAAAKPKRKSLELDSGDWKDLYRWIDPAPRVYPLREMLRMTTREVLEGGGAQIFAFRVQTSCLVEHLMNSRDKRLKAVIPTYLNGVKDALREGDFFKDLADLDEPKNEEEEEAYLKALEEIFDGRREEIMKAGLDAAFAGWTDADWEKLEKDYLDLFL